MIRITSKRHLFRRAGMAHPKGPVEYPDDRFTDQQLKALAAEAMLIVEEIKAPEVGLRPIGAYAPVGGQRSEVRKARKK